jgi:hypothetical protein
MTMAKLDIMYVDPSKEYDRQWLQEVETFEDKRPQLLEKYEGQYVAFYQGEVIDADDDDKALFLRVCEKYGWDTPIYFQWVLREGIPIVNVPGIDID